MVEAPPVVRDPPRTVEAAAALAFVEGLGTMGTDGTFFVCF
jgi:hypothetical protein